MRLPLLFMICSLAAHVSVYAQAYDQRSLWGTNNGYLHFDPRNKVMMQFEKRYRFPDFTEGVVVYKDGQQLVAKLNYNVAMDELRFINDKADTVGIADPETISYAAIDSYRFYFVKGKYLQTIEKKAGITLAYNQEVKTFFEKNYLPYTNSNERTNYVVDVPEFSNADQQKINFEYEGWSGTTFISKNFYFGDGYGNFAKANKRNLLRIFEKQSPLIDQYIENHAINFNKLSDVQNVLHFCETLN